MDILQIENVSKSYTNHKALDDVSLAVPRGSVYGLLGPNGAGKTTLIRIINHITAPDGGRVIFDGHPLKADDVAHIGYLPEERGLYKKMKVGDQALFFAKLKGLKASEAAVELRRWFDRLEISDWWDKKVEELSKGMAQKVQFIVTVLHRPKLLIFDEPFSGFDPINADILTREILRLNREEGSTVIFSTHNMESVEALCENITLINRSRNILSGNVAEIRARLGQGRYTISFDGDPDALFAALGDRILASSVTKEHGLLKASLRLRPDIDRREVITLANNAVDLVTFDRALPSMNDIFIRTVEDYNRRHGITSTDV
ncbi:MAG: ATP-binding cassette domain-containing protein [[Clostridium] fimetarium]|nr:ATP-binding cassette domain-containing protein [Alistipes timonensis]MCM1406040.1 ATP-binding cassette domain-containing protein [[Clostridium] fimetarium]